MGDAFSSAELEGQRDFLRRLARGLVRSAEEADDLVQDAFVRALERPPASARALRAWLASVLRNLALNRARTTGRVAQHERRAARPERVEPPDAALASLELQERIVAAVKALDEPYRTTLWLRYHEDLPPRAIAERLAAPVKTIEARLARGLAALRAELDRRSGGDRTHWLGGVLALARAEPTTLVLVLGVGLVKKLVLAAVAVLVLVLGWRALPLARGSGPTPMGAATLRPGPAPAVVTLDAQPAERAPAVPVPSATPAEDVTALRVRVRWSDGSPASGVGLIVRPEADPRGARAFELVTSDAEGLVRVVPIHPGPVRVEADRGGEARGEVRAGAETQLELLLDPGLELEGLVTDPAGLPLAGAEILLVAEAADWLAPRVVARTGANGSYAVRDVQPDFSVTARAGRLAQALLEPLRGRTGRVRIDFTLGHEGAGLRGIVRDARGAPVAGALVAVGDPEGWYVEDDDTPGIYRDERPMRLERTDALGRFEAPGVSPGFGLQLAVQAGAFPLAVANVSAEIGSTSFVEVVLDDPAVLTGVVHGPDGAPLAGAELALLLCEGADAKEIPFDLPVATSDAAGAFRLGPLPRSSVLRLAPPAGGPGATTLVALTLAPGETSRELVLAPDDAVRGRVLAAPDVRFEGWFVQLHQQLGAGRMKRAPLAPDGRFEVAGCDQPPYRLELYAASNRPVLRRDEVGPGAELELVAEPLGSIRGELVDEAALLQPAGTPPSVSVSFREHVTLAPSWQEGGRFAFELLRPGRYRIRIQHGAGLLFATTVDLAPGSSLDLGRIASAEPGSLVLALEPPAEGGFSGSVVDSSHEHVAFVELVDGRLGVAALPPGEHLLALEGSALASRILPFTIRSGERTELVVPTQPGVPRSLAFPLRGRAWEVLTVELHDAEGGLVLHRRLQRRYWPAAGGTPTLLVTLAVGTYALVAEIDTGLAVSASFDVPALEPQERALSFEMR